MTSDNHALQNRVVTKVPQESYNSSKKFGIVQKDSLLDQMSKSKMVQEVPQWIEDLQLKQ